MSKDNFQKQSPSGMQRPSQAMVKCNLEAVEDAPFGVSELLSNLILCLERLWMQLGMQTHFL